MSKGQDWIRKPRCFHCRAQHGNTGLADCQGGDGRVGPCWVLVLAVTNIDLE